MMSIQSMGLSGVDGQRPPGPPPGGNTPAAAVSDLLGMSTQEIESQLASGSSLSDIASAQGVSHDNLITALREGMPAEMQGAANVDEVLEMVATKQGLGPAEGPPPPPPPQTGEATGVLTGQLTDSQQLVVDVLGDLLEMDSEQVASELRAGTSLVDLLEQGDVDAAGLTSVLDVGALYDGRI